MVIRINALAAIVLIGMALAINRDPAAKSQELDGCGKVRPEVYVELDSSAEAAVIISLAAASPSMEEVAARAGDEPEHIISKLQEATGLQQERVLADLAASDFILALRPTTVPALVGTITSEGLTKIGCHVDVAAVGAIFEGQAALPESVPLINSNAVNLGGVDGSSVDVAVFDSGIDTDHPDLDSSLAGEECFTDSFPPSGGVPCPPQPHPAEDGSGHGTHVSGIIASDGRTLGIPQGVAPGVNLYAYRMTLDNGDWLTPWLLNALDDVMDNHGPGDPVPFEFLNISLALAQFPPNPIATEQECRDLIPAISLAIEDLRDVGTLTIAASGNQGFKDSISWPACIPDVVSVGAVYDADVGTSGPYPVRTPEPDSTCTDQTTAADKVVCFSESADWLDLLAPGCRTLSTWHTGFGANELCGTSQAAPHVVGVAALLKQMLPGITADELVQVLKDTGVPITDAANGITTPRVDARAAVLDDDFDGDGCTNYYEFVSVTDPEIVDCDSSVSDILVGSVNTGAGSFYCITKTDHNTITNAVQTFQQCNIDLADSGGAPDPSTRLEPPTWGDTCEALAARVPPECVSGPGDTENQLNNPSETGADTLAGPPPPPPYTNMAPGIGTGLYFDSSGFCAPVECTVVTTCFEDVGGIGETGVGPNIIWTSIILDPKGGVTVQADTNGDTVKDTQVDRVSSGGSVNIWYNQDNDSCDALTPKGAPDFEGLPLQSIQVNDEGGTNVNPNPAPWRPGPKPGSSVLDFDGDGCTDEDELAAVPDCGDDPQNPSDSFAPGAGLSGIYDLSVRVTRGDCVDDQCTAEVPGVYFFCRADLQHDTGDNSVTVRTYCYWDDVTVEINPQAYPGITGDGMAGAPPPGPEADPLCPSTCGPDPGSGIYAYGDVDTAHAELDGTFDRLFANNLEISGCIANEDDPTLGNVYVELTVSAHQLPGTADIWTSQTPTNCNNGTPAGSPTFDDAELSLVQANPNKSGSYDQDDDGVPDSRELQDDTACGRRDPFNKNDYYDVSIPRDGVIDLANDILGTIVHFAPGGYLPGDENWDRPPAMIGAGGNWNRGSPDGVIDLANDILGVILQFNPGGCPAQQ